MIGCLHEPDAEEGGGLVLPIVNRLLLISFPFRRVQVMLFGVGAGAEAAAVMARAVLSIVLVYAGHGLMSTAYAQLAYGAVMCLVYGTYFVSQIRVRE